MIRSLTLLISISLLGPISFYSQSFNGLIEFRFATQKDTTMNVYSVKNKMVRLDQYNKKNKTIDGSFLFDLESADIRFMSPKRKLWGTQKSDTPQNVKGTCVVNKGTSVKTIVGIRCNEYTVKNSAENTVITYWIADGNYDFFIPMLKLRNGKDKQSVYFSQIRNLAEGSMPLLSEEKQLTDGKLITRLEVIKITNTPPADAVMQIPADYSKFD